MAKVNPRYEEAVAEEKASAHQLQEFESELDALRSKQGRYSQFSNKADRDAFIKKVIAQNRQDLRLQSDGQAEAAAHLASVQETLAATVNKISESVAAIDNSKSEISKIDSEFRQLRNDREVCEGQRKELWRKEAKLLSAVSKLKQDSTKAVRALQGTVDRATWKGITSVQEIVNRLQIKGYHGPLYTLFNVEERFRSAVEVVAGASLFHVVVDDDEIASRILEVLNKEKAGRVTFMPLNRIQKHNATYPDSQEAIALVSHLQFEPVYQLAMYSVFGKAIICPSLEIAAQFARSHSLTAVTLDGDRADRKGALSGGYKDSKQSRLECASLLRDLAIQQSESEVLLDSVKKEIHALDSNILKTRDNMTKLEQERRQLVNSRQQLADELETMNARKTQTEKQVSNVRASLATFDDDINGIETQIKMYQEEIKSPMRETLTSADTTRLQKLKRQADQLKKVLAETIIERTKLETDKSVIEMELQMHLNPRREQLRLEIESIGEFDGLENNVSESRMQLESYSIKTRESLESLEEIERNIEEKEGLLGSETGRLEKTLQEQAAHSRVIEQQQRVIEKFIGKKCVLIQKKEAAVDHIRDLGVLPEEAFEKYADKETPWILRHLHRVNDILKKYENVNKKAFEQYGNFTKQRDQLETRKDELEKSYEATFVLLSLFKI